MHGRRALWGAMVVCAGSVLISPGVSSQSATGAPAQPPPVQGQTKPAGKVSPIPAAAANPETGWEERTIKVPVAGTAHLYVPRHPTTSNVVLFMSGDGGWSLGVVDMARRMMPKAIVIGMSYLALRRAPGSTAACWFPSGDLETIAHDAEQQLKLAAYEPPALVGYSSGATMAYEALAASPFSFAGGLALGFCPDLPASHSLCAADAFKPPPRDPKKNIVMLPKVRTLDREFFVLNGAEDQICRGPGMHAFLDDMPHAHFVEAAGTGHGFARPGRWGPDFDELFDKLLEAATAANHPKRQPSVSAPGTAAALEPDFEALELPLEYEWAGQTRAILVFASGDGGWMALDRGVARYLVAHGISVVGLNTQSYFWNPRTPEESGADLGRIVDVAATLEVPVLVGGYSLGAETTPFMLDAWPEAARAKVHGEILIAPSKTATFSFHVLNMLFRAKPTPYVVADAVKNSHVPTFCLSGGAEEARDTACIDMGTAAQEATLPGGHHFDGDYDAIGKLVLAFIDGHL